MTRDGPLSLNELRERLLKLSELQAELRSYLSKYMESAGETIYTVANKANVEWSTLRRFDAKQTAVCTPKVLGPLCELLDCVDLGQSIVELAEPLPDRRKVFASYPASVIALSIDVMVAQERYADNASLGEFCAAFGPDAEVVKGIFKGTNKALDELIEPGIQERVLMTLLEDLDTRINDIIADREKTKQARIAVLEALIKQLLEKYVQKTALAEALGVSYATLHSAEIGRSSLTTIDELISTAENLLINPGEEAEKTTAQQVESAYQTLQERYGTQRAIAEALGTSTSTLQDIIYGRTSLKRAQLFIEDIQRLLGTTPTAVAAKSDEASDEQAEPAAEVAVASQQPSFLTLGIPPNIGGETTDDGVPFVLTEASFQALEDVPLIALRDSLIAAIRVTRLQLNIGSQLKDPAARRILQDAVGKEVKELELAIRTFTFAHPNELLALYDSQRAAWQGNKSKTGSKGSR